MRDAAKGKVAIIGARGMLGSDLAPRLAAAGCDVVALDLPEFDLTRRELYSERLAGAGMIVNCAAFTNVDLAESQSAKAMLINGTAPGYLGEWAAQHKAYLIHISTDFVFDGRSSRPYRETDQPNPISVYGQSKLEGETAVLRTCPGSAILRLQWSYGRHGVNFISKLLDRARGGGELRVVDDQIGSPTWTGDIARAIERLAQVRPEGIYHFAASGSASRFEVAQFIARRLGLPNPVVSCASSDFQQAARRPANSRFDTAKVRAVLGYSIPRWDESLAAFLGAVRR